MDRKTGEVTCHVDPHVKTQKTTKNLKGVKVGKTLTTWSNLDEKLLNGVFSVRKRQRVDINIATSFE